MPKKQSTGLPGGRAYYRGQNAYASQGFETDTRAEGAALGSLLIAFPADASSDILVSGLGTSAYTIPWGSPLTIAGGRLSNQFLRGFSLDPTTNSFTCLRAGTFEIDWRIAGTVPANATMFGILVITAKDGTNFNAEDYQELRIALATRQSVGGRFIADLQKGDKLSMSILYTVAGGDVRRATPNTLRPTYLIARQIDF